MFNKISIATPYTSHSLPNALCGVRRQPAKAFSPPRLFASLPLWFLAMVWGLLLGFGQIVVQAAPTAVTLNASVQGEGSSSYYGATAQLSWSQNNDEDFGGYYLYRASHAEVTEQDTLVTSLTDAWQHENYDYGLTSTPTPGTTYYYRVFVHNQAGQSTGSNETSLTFIDAAPAAVTLATPQTGYYGNDVQLSWTRNYEYDLADYKIYRATHSEVTQSDTLVATFNANDVYGDPIWSYDSNAPATPAPGTRYYYRVFVTDQAGQSTGSNEESLLCLDSAPSAVTLNDATASSYSYYGGVDLNWTRNSEYDVATYEVYRATHPGVTLADTLVYSLNANLAYGDPIWSTDGGATASPAPGTTYYYRIFVTDNAGQSTGSNEKNVTLLDAAPAAVTLATPQTGYYGNDVQLSWTRNYEYDLDSYRLYRATHAGVTDQDTLVATINASDVSGDPVYFYDSNAPATPAPGTRYYYRVFVTDNAGQSTGSNEESLLCLDSAPSAVTLNQPQAGYYGSEVQLNWSRSSEYDIATYNVYRATHAGVTVADTLVYSVNAGDAYGDPIWGYDSNALATPAPGTTYYYRVFVTDNAGQSIGSNEESLTLLDSAPSTVTLETPTSYYVGYVQLSWTRDYEYDLASYQLYRATHTGVTEQDTLVATINANDAYGDPIGSYDSLGDATGTFYYRVFVVDNAGQSTGSNEVLYSNGESPTPTPTVAPTATPTVAPTPTPTNCPEGTHWEEDQEGCNEGGSCGSCVPNDPSCPVGQYWDEGTQSCQVDPFYCPTGQYWSESTQSCQSIPNCPEGQYWDEFEEVCVTLDPCPAGQHWDEETQSCQPNESGNPCPDGQYWDEATQSCQPDESGNPCPDGQYWDESSQSCQPIPNCPEGQYWDEFSLSCMNDPFYCPAGQYWDELSQTCLIDPFYCPDGMYWSESTQGCQSIPNCPEGQYWDEFAESCLPLDPGCPEGQYWSESTQSCQPIPACPEGQYWDVESESCSGGVPVCPPGEVWDETTQSCQPIPPAPIPPAPAPPPNDCIALDPPQVTATAGASSVTLSWPPITGAENYRIYTNGVSYTVTGTSNPVATEITGLTAGVQYCYRVSAYSICYGPGPLSNDVCAIPSGNGNPTPTPVTPEYMNLRVTAVGNQQVSLAWTGVIGATGYSLQRYKSGNGFVDVNYVTGTSITDTGLTNGVTYQYQIKVFGANNASLGFSNVVSATPSGNGGGTPTATPFPTATPYVPAQVDLSVNNAYPQQITGTGTMKLGIVIGVDSGESISTTDSNFLTLRIYESNGGGYREETFNLNSKQKWQTPVNGVWSAASTAPSSLNTSNGKIFYGQFFDWNTTQSWPGTIGPGSHAGLSGHNGVYKFRLMAPIKFTKYPYSTTKIPTAVTITVANSGVTPTPTTTTPTPTPTVNHIPPDIAIWEPSGVIQSLTRINGSASGYDNSMLAIQSVKLALQRCSDGMWWNGSAWQSTQLRFVATLGSDANSWEKTANATLPRLPAGANLPSENYIIKAIAYDFSGHSASTQTQVTIDKVAPVMTITEPIRNSRIYHQIKGIKGGWSDFSRPGLSGSGLSEARVFLSQYLGDDQPYKVWNGANGQWENKSADKTTWPWLPAVVGSGTWELASAEVAKLPPAPDVPAIKYTVSVEGYDQSRNVGRASHNFTVATDHADPTVSITTPANGSIIYVKASSAQSLSGISGTAGDVGGGLDKVEVRLYRTNNNKTRQKWTGTEWRYWNNVISESDPVLTTTLVGSGVNQTWSVTGALPQGINLGLGDYTVQATAIDLGGNVTNATSLFKVALDTTAPTLNLLTPVTGSIAVRLPQVSGTANDTQSGIGRVELTLYQRTSSGDYKIWNGTNWNYTTASNGSAWVAHQAIVTPGSTGVTWSRTAGWPKVEQFLAREYVVRARAFDKAGNGSSYATATIKVQRIAQGQMQYSLDGGTTWKHVPQQGEIGYPLSVDQRIVKFKGLRANTGWGWPSGKSLWSGDTAVAGRRGESVEAKFNSYSVSATDFKEVTAECGTQVTARLTTHNRPVVLSVDSAHVTAHEVPLSWTQKSGEFSRYELHWSTTPNFTPSNSTLLATFTNKGTTQYTDNWVPDNTINQYKIVVCDDIGISATSNEVSITTPVDVIPDAVQLHVTQEGITQTEVPLWWLPNEDDDFYIYEMHCSTEPNFITSDETVIGYSQYQEDSSFWDNQLEPNTTHYYKLRVYDWYGYAADSNEVVATTLSTPPSLTPVMLWTDGEILPTEVPLAWSKNEDANFGKYELHRSTNADFTPVQGTYLQTFTNRESTQFMDEGLNGNTNYYYKVVVYDTAGGLSSPSNEIEVTTQPVLPLEITTAALPGASVGVPYDHGFQATGGDGKYLWLVSITSVDAEGNPLSAPAGLTFETGTGRLLGTPSIAGTWNLVAIVSDGAKREALKNFTITVSDSTSEVAITTTNLPKCYVEEAYSVNLQATGGYGAFTWSVDSGELPEGLELSPQGQLSGKATIGSYLSAMPFTVRVESENGKSVTQTFNFSLDVSDEFLSQPISVPSGYGLTTAVRRSVQVAPSTIKNDTDIPAQGALSANSSDIEMYVTCKVKPKAAVTILTNINNKVGPYRYSGFNPTAGEILGSWFTLSGKPHLGSDDGIRVGLGAIVKGPRSPHGYKIYTTEFLDQKYLEIYSSESIKQEFGQEMQRIRVDRGDAPLSAGKLRKSVERFWPEAAQKKMWKWVGQDSFEWWQRTGQMSKVILQRSQFSTSGDGVFLICHEASKMRPTGGAAGVFNAIAKEKLLGEYAYSASRDMQIASGIKIPAKPSSLVAVELTELEQASLIKRLEQSNKAIQNAAKTAKLVKALKFGSTALLLVSIPATGYEIWTADNRELALAEEGAGWAGAWSFGWVGTRSGAAAAAVLFAPANAVPGAGQAVNGSATIIGGLVVGVPAAIYGYYQGKGVGRKIYYWTIHRK